MNIYAKEGHKVMVTEDTIDNGYEIDSKQVKELCKLNVPYTIDHTVVHGWSTDVYLKEFPGVCFNSANFEDVKVYHIIHTEGVDKYNKGWPVYYKRYNKGHMLQSNLYDASKYVDIDEANKALEYVCGLYSNREFNIISIDSRVFGPAPRNIEIEHRDIKE